MDSLDNLDFLTFICHFLALSLSLPSLDIEPSPSPSQVWTLHKRAELSYPTVLFESPKDLRPVDVS